MLVDVDRNSQDLKKWMEIYETVGDLSKTAFSELEDDLRKLLGDETSNGSVVAIQDVAFARTSEAISRVTPLLVRRLPHVADAHTGYEL